MRVKIRGRPPWTEGQRKEETGWELLLRAIILQAVHDYRRARKVLYRYPHDPAANKIRWETESFLRTGWVYGFLDLDPDALADRLCRET